jgi:chromobox protein 1
MASTIPKSAKAATKTKKHDRPSTDLSGANGKRQKKGELAIHPKDSTPPKSVAAKWQPPSGSWEDEVQSVDALEGTNKNEIQVFLHWRNNKKTKHPVEVVYKRCPQKVRLYPCTNKR